MEKFLNFLLIFVPIAIVSEYMHAPGTVVFFLCALSLVPLAKFIGESVDELSMRTGTAVGGLLNATFGNATEIIVGIFALRAGLITVVKSSITGAVLANLLLAVGLSMFFGGRKRIKQTFNATAMQSSSSTLMIAVIALVVPAVFFLSTGTTGSDTSVTMEDLSLFVSVLIIITYAASLVFSLYTHKHLYTEEVGKFMPKWSVGKSVTILLSATLAVSWLSEILVGSIEPVVSQFGWSEYFIGAVLVAIIGSVAEVFSAVRVAVQDRMDLAVQIGIGSATQIIMLAAPLLVIAGSFMPTKMSLVFNPFELTGIILSVFIVSSVVSDGESNWLEGLQLLMAYLIIATAFFFYR